MPKATPLGKLKTGLGSLAALPRRVLEWWRRPRPKRLASFQAGVDMSRVPEECYSHVIYAVLSPNPRQRFRLTITLLPKGYPCKPSCDNEETLPRDPWRCRKLVMCCHSYRIEREWTTTR